MKRLLTLLVVIGLTGCSDAVPGFDSDAPEMTTLPAVTTTSTPPATVATVPPTMPPAPPSGLCRSYEEPVTTGTVALAEVNEVSGIAVSRDHQDVIWMHNDSRGGPLLYAANRDGTQMGIYTLATATFDWEDMAIGPGPDPERDYLYLGDIGDNFHFRPTVVVHRIAEPNPTPDGGTVEEVDVIELVYPDPGHDAESLFVDPVTGALIVVTKPDAGGIALIFSAPADQLVAGATVDLVQIGSFDLDPGLFVTAAAIDSSGSVIVFRGYNEVWLWQRTDLSLVDTFTAEPCMVPSTAEVQGEAIAFVAEGYSYYTMSEGSEPDINFVSSVFD